MSAPATSDTKPGMSPSAAPKSPASTFLDNYRREHATTTKVLRAYPQAQAAFRPHERSSPAIKLAWTFVVESRLALLALQGHQQVVGQGFTPCPDSWEDVLAAFDAQHTAVAEYLEGVVATNPMLEGTVDFFTGPKQMGEYPMADFLWFMLHDHIHHRGQLSVYLRMAGGKVPSIYGPSADEPWN